MRTKTQLSPAASAVLSTAVTAVTWKWITTSIMMERVAALTRVGGFPPLLPHAPISLTKEILPVPLAKVVLAILKENKMTITNTVSETISSTFICSDTEKGFLLGSSRRLSCIDNCAELQELNAGKYFYEPDPTLANEIINRWRKNGVCFSGFIHSHVVPKMELSEDDIEFAKRLFSSFKLPVLWFGIGILCNEKIVFKFFSVQEIEGQIEIGPEEVNFTC